MIGASKILTVSYGTFSCTLEGFDEPFNTMKAIAEYFRDLAAEDRYFGAEPPTPDAAMLHRIAEREIHRRVEAKIQDNGVHLRAAEPDSAMAHPPAPVLVPVPALTDAAPAATSAVAKLSLIRAAQVASPVLAAAVVSDPAQSYSEDEHADDMLARLTAPHHDAAGEDIAGLDDESSVTLDELIPAQPGPDSAVVSEEETDSTPDYQLEEDLAIAARADDADDFETDLADLAALDGRPRDVTALDQPPVDDEQLAEDIAAGSEQPAAGALESESAFLASLGAMTDPAPEPVGMMDDADDATTRGHFESMQDWPIDLATEPEAEAQATMPAAPVAPVESAAPETGDKLQRARARVIKVRRIDARVAAAAARDETVLAAPPAPAPPASAPRGLLSDEAEAALQAELAALEFEEGLEFEEDLGKPLHETASRWDSDADSPDEPTVQPASDLRKRINAESGDDAVTRLMAQTNTVMDGPDIRRRQSAISHLKAAVAATVAERQIEGSDGQSSGETRSDPYRDDLDRAVRPRGPQAATSNDAPLPSGNTERLSPLVLVSEQRINRPKPAPEPMARPARVRPRRVASANLALQQQEKAPDALNLDGEDTVNLFAESQSFAEFAESLGATRLPDALEAAAVYCAQVLKCPQFTRPQLLNQLSTLPGAAGVSLEDCLRSFGELLRQGRVVRLRRGQFALTDSSPYLRDRDRTAG